MAEPSKRERIKTAREKELADVKSWACCAWPEHAVNHKYRADDLAHGEKVAMAGMLFLAKHLATDDKPSTTWIQEAIAAGEAANK